MAIPRIDDHLPELMPFIRELAAAYHADEVTHAQHTLDDREKLVMRVRAFFTPERMEAFERVIPGWVEMASYADGITLIHEMSVLVALVLLPEYKTLSAEQQRLSEWIMLFHDVEKKLRGKRDHVHPFRSAANAGRTLGALGFEVYGDADQIDAWARVLSNAIKLNGNGEEIPDNSYLPEITDGIRALFGWDTPGGLIVRGVLFHQIIDNIEEYPQAAPLTVDEVRRYINAPLFPVLEVVMLADSDAWALFDLERRARWREETHNVFANLSRMLGRA
ncbi:MAG: hypothetical protein IAE80_12240 [Anaerolinea sp.]|nr:hypothetical protein [Anaerolinea sp.]